MMRHPRDSKASKQFDSTHPWFAYDSRHVLIPYNSPPWVCMKQTSFILLIIISRRKIPRNDIDAYFQVRDVQITSNFDVDY